MKPQDAAAGTTIARQIERTYNLAQGLFWVSVALPVALSVLLMQARGSDLLQIGALMGVYALSAVMLEFPSGALADTIGRKRVALLAYALMLLAQLVFFFSFAFLGFLLAWALMGAGRAFASGALQAWFVDSLLAADPEAELQPPLARAATFELLALTVGTLAGSYLPGLFAALPEDGSALLTPLTVPLLAAIFMKAVLILFVLLAVEEAPVKKTQAKPHLQLAQVVRAAFGLSRSNHAIMLLLFASLAAGFAVAGLEAFWQPHFASLLGGHEGNTVLFGVIMAGSFFVGMLGNLASIPLSRLLKQRYALVAGIFRGLSGFLLLLLALQGAVVPAVGLFWLLYLTSGTSLSPHSALFNRELPKEQRATMLSLESLVGYGGAFAGSVLLGALAETFSVAVAWAVAGGVMALSSAAYLLLERVPLRQPVREAQAGTSAGSSRASAP